MKAITLMQPWAALVALGAKRIETRSWATHYRGPLAIHAAKVFPATAKDLCYTEPFRSALGFPKDARLLHEDPEPAWVDEARKKLDALPRGIVIATCRLATIKPTDLLTSEIGRLSEQERAFGDFSPGRYAWILDDIVALAVPVPAKGSLGLWEWHDDAVPA